MKAVNDYGLDADLAKKANAKYDFALQDKVQAWIENVSNITFDKDFGPMLQDGVVLCNLVNAIIPGRIKKINTTGNLYKKQENISSFLRVCREIGVAEHSLFATNTLSHLQDLNQVLTCMIAFSVAIQRNQSIKYDGPVLGIKVNEKKKAANKPAKKWEIGKGGGVSLLNQGSRGIMQETKYTNARDMIKSQRLTGGGSSGVSLLNQGSRGIMQETKYTNARDMIQSKKLEGGGSSGVSMLNNGSRGVMQETKYTNARDMIQSKKLEGGGSSGVSMLNNGSAGVMEREKYSDAREMIKRDQL